MILFYSPNDAREAAGLLRGCTKLKGEGRTTNNYLFTGANTEALFKALDPAAPGPVPHTVVITPGGKVVYRRAGQLDLAEVQAKLIDELGPYYK